MNINKIQFKTKELKNFAIKLLKNNFRVYTTTHQPTTYIKFTENNNIGYAQDHWFGGIDLSTVHKPNYYVGTGYGLNKTGINNPTLHQARETFTIQPYWGNPTHQKYIKKYKNWDEFIKLEKVLKYIEITL